MKQINWIGSIFVLSLVLVGCVNRQAQEQAKKTEAVVADPRIAVTIAPVRQKDVPITLLLTGSLKADHDLSVSAKLPGRLISVLAREGDYVQAGQVVARQESGDSSNRLLQAQAVARAAKVAVDQAKLNAKVTPTKTDAAVKASEARLRQAQANLQKLLNGSREQEKKQAKARVDQAKSELDTATSAYERAQRLFDQGAIAKAQLEAEENRFRQAQAAYTQALEAYNLVLDAIRPEDIEQAREAVRQAEEQLRIDRANKELDKTLDQTVESAEANYQSALESVRIARKAVDDLVIRANVSGRVSGKPVSVGTMVSAGVPIMRIVSSGNLYFMADVPEDDVVKLQPGMDVDVKIAALDSVSIAGVITSIDPLASELGRLYSVRIAIRENLGVLKPGMFAKGEVVLGSDKDAIVVPTESILTEGNSKYVFITNGTADKQTVEKVKIEIDRQVGNEALVFGVKAGQRVVTKGKTELLDGSLVNVSEPANAESGE